MNDTREAFRQVRYTLEHAKWSDENELALEALTRLEAEHAEREAEAAAMRAVLQQIQWCITIGSSDAQWCPTCPKESSYGHAHDCTLNAALSGQAGRDRLAARVAAMEGALLEIAKETGTPYARMAEEGLRAADVLRTVAGSRK